MFPLKDDFSNVGLNTSSGFPEEIANVTLCSRQSATASGVAIRLTCRGSIPCSAATFARVCPLARAAMILSLRSDLVVLVGAQRTWAPFLPLRCLQRIFPCLLGC